MTRVVCVCVCVSKKRWMNKNKYAECQAMEIPTSCPTVPLPNIYTMQEKVKQLLSFPRTCIESSSFTDTTGLENGCLFIAICQNDVKLLP